ncbi:Ank 2 domain containing protein [Trichuris trichiura]|uniref:Ank 2 domain containing protein n=1 Tax=Trichuris trichiura TaxID=36087 RepID=A0A077Z8I3_TRITR|nr:Ank 2 domain containing protein [Trichuris trichiura]
MGDECGATEDSEKEVDSLCCDRYRDFVQASSSLEQMEKRSVSDSAASDSSRGQDSARTSSSTASSTSEMIQQPDFRLMCDMPSWQIFGYRLFLLYFLTLSITVKFCRFCDGYVAGVPALEPYAEMLRPDLESGFSVLSVAASAGYCELVHVLLNCMRMGPDYRGPKGDCTPLMDAASAGHTDVVRCLVEHGADVNAHSSIGNTPLIYACAAGHEEAVEILLDAGADVDLCNDNGQSPLMEAAAAGHIGIARLLVDHGARVNFASSELKVGLETPLTLACYRGHTDMVKFLLKVGGENNSAGREEELHTALMEASMDGHVEVAKLLLEAGAQVNLAADTFESPLTLAACGGHLDLAKLYLSKGASLEEFNEEGYTPLMEASREGHFAVVRLLVESGADVNMLSRRGESTLALAAGANFRNIVAYLLSKGADIERGATTALMEAAQEGNYETLNYLLESGANVHTATSQGDTAMSYAAQSGQTKICEVLLAAGASLEHQGEVGRTALMKAAGAGQRETVEFLLRKGANLNLATFDNDQTALSAACGNGQLAMVDFLLQIGADPKVRLKDGSSCLLEAAKGGHTRVVQYLLDWPESSGSAAQYNSCCVIPPSTMVPSICDAETVTADSTVYAPVVTDASLMTSSAEAMQAILANGTCSTTVMAANTFTRGLPLVVTPLGDYVGAAPAGSVPPVNVPNLAVTSDGSIYYPSIPQADGKKAKKHCTARPASGADDSTAHDLLVQWQETFSRFLATKEQPPTTDDDESACKSVKSRRAELDEAVKELEQLKKTQKMYENLKGRLSTHKLCVSSAAQLYDRDYGCFSAGNVAAECKHLYETPCYRQVVIDPANANVAVTSVTDVAAVHKMELYAAAVDGQTDGETCHSSQFQFLHPHVNVVVPVPHSCAGQQSLPCNFVVSREENVCFSPAVSVAMVSVTASEAAAIYRNSSCYGYSGNVMPLEGVSTAAGVIPANYAVANGEKLYIPVHLAQQDINSAAFHGFAAGSIPTLGNLPQGVIPVQARPASAMVAVPTFARDEYDNNENGDVLSNDNNRSGQQKYANAVRLRTAASQR